MLEPADAELRASVIQDIEDMDAIIAQFLAYVHDGKDEAMVDGDLNALVAQVARRVSAGDTHIRLALAPLPLIAFKPLAMQRVLTNLLDNAVRYATGDIDVCTESIDGAVRVRVLDRGPGIPAHERERLTQPFTRLAHAGSAGVGLGLAIVARIARAQGARFALLDREGGGLEARLELPATTVPASDTAAAAPATA
jgi:two-component system osmolarity sensor histidine kinase EnvZ